MIKENVNLMDCVYLMKFHNYGIVSNKDVLEWLDILLPRLAREEQVNILLMACDRQIISNEDLKMKYAIDYEAEKEKLIEDRLR